MSNIISDVSTFDHFIKEVKDPKIFPLLSFRPIIFQLGLNEEEHFRQFCKDQQIYIVDKIDQQLQDWARVNFPSDQQKEKRQEFVTNLLANHDSSITYGNWVYLPWQMNVVHVLPENAYYGVITNRNLFKITKDEQRQLRTKRIGVIGLSVGAEAAITVAQEHLCGEIAIADFDELDLSNLNRLNARFDEIGLPKTTITARRIVSINPYLKISVFDEGINEQNIYVFLEGLDLLLEECDDLALKFKIREEAKRKTLNIIYAADERGFISIEPYEYARDFDVFHGKIEQPPPPKESFSSEQDFWRALTEWLGGWEQISERSRESVQQIGESLCGYPQLASEARFAAGQVGFVARRLLLGEKLKPLLKHQDLNSFISSNP